MNESNNWKFDTTSAIRGRKLLSLYNNFVDHGSNLSEDDIKDFSFDKLDEHIMDKILYATCLRTILKGHSDETPSFGEFVTAINHEDFGHKGFEAGNDELTPNDEDAPLLGASLVSASTLPKVGTAVGQALRGAVNDGIRRAAPPGLNTDQLRAWAIKTAETATQALLLKAKFGKGGGVGNGGIPDGGNSKQGYSGGSTINPTGMSLNNKPVPTSFTTPIAMAGEAKFYLNGSEESSPLLMKIGIPGLVDGSGNGSSIFYNKQINEWLNGPITGTWIAQIQSQIVWTNQIRDIITKNKIVKYVNSLIFALSVYYFYQSVLAYTSDNDNRNAGMYALRDQITAADYIELSLLKVNIEQSLIPPYLHKMCHKFMGNYKQSMDPGSPLIKLCPWMMTTSTTMMYSGLSQASSISGDTYSALTYANKLIRSNTVRDITAVLARSASSWLGQEPLGYITEPMYDVDFCTLWTNAVYKTTSTGHITEQLPEISTTNDVITVNLRGDAPDGYISAFLSINDTDSQKLGPGLCNACIPISDSDNLLEIVNLSSTVRSSTETIYVDGPTGPGFYATMYNSDWSNLASNTYTANYGTTGHTKYQQFGTGRLNFVNQQNLTPTVMQMLELIYTSDLQSIRDPRSSSSGGRGYSKSSTRGKSRRGKSDKSNYKSSKEEFGKPVDKSEL